MRRAACAIALSLIATPALAHHHRHHHHYRHYAHRSHHGGAEEARGESFGGRPRAWCGWFMRQVKGVSDPAYNLAANWPHWGRPTTVHPGAVVVWRHHVGEVAEGSCPAGQWMVHSGNDGHAVRTRCRSLAGVIAIRE